MDLAFLGAAALGGIGLIASLVMAIIMDGGKVDRAEGIATVAQPSASARPLRR